MFSGCDLALKAMQIQHDGRVPFNADDPLVAIHMQNLVDHLPGGTDPSGQIGLGQVQVDLDAAVCDPLARGQFQQYGRHPAGHVQEGQVLGVAGDMRQPMGAAAP